MLPSDLLNGYLATCYQIHDPSIDIYISKENSALNSFLIQNNYFSWCFITAWNPFSIAQTKEVNEIQFLMIAQIRNSKRNVRRNYFINNNQI